MSSSSGTNKTNIANNTTKPSPLAHFHLPGLFEFYNFYKEFLPLFYTHREYFYEWAEIASIYGAPADCIWGGGRVGFGEDRAEDVLSLLQKYKISPRLTFSNSLLKPEHLTDKKCNNLCKLFEKLPCTQKNADKKTSAGVIVHSELLLTYLRQTYPNLYFVSSTTKVLTDFQQFQDELARDEFSYVVPDFRLNKQMEKLENLSPWQKDKVEFLCNECCWIGCTERKNCYENVSRKSLGEPCPDHPCQAPGGKNGYKFSTAMKNPAFIGINDIQKNYLPKGFSNFKIEGRSLGTAVLLEFLLHYLTKPEYHLQVRESLYLDSTLDLF